MVKRSMLMDLLGMGGLDKTEGAIVIGIVILVAV